MREGAHARKRERERERERETERGDRKGGKGEGDIAFIVRVRKGLSGIGVMASEPIASIYGPWHALCNCFLRHLNARRRVSGGRWNGFDIQSAIVTVFDGKPKILISILLKPLGKHWNYKLRMWEEKVTVGM